MHNLAHVAVQINFGYIQRSEKLHFGAFYLFSILLDGLRHPGRPHVDFLMAMNHGGVQVSQRVQFRKKVRFRPPFLHFETPSGTVIQRARDGSNTRTHNRAGQA